jgi:hypothetical protein
LRKQHYEMIECDAAKLQIWFKHDRRREYGIKNIQLSFTEEEENRLIVDKYSKVDISLQCFGLPDTFLWVEKVDKVKTVEVDNTNKIIAELKKGSSRCLFVVQSLLITVLFVTVSDARSQGASG